MRGFQLGPWFIDALRHMAVRSSTEVSLSTNEAHLLLYLHEQRDRAPIARDELLVEVYGYAPGVKSRAVDMSLTRLRGKLEHQASSPELLLARRGRGLYLEQNTEVGAATAELPSLPGRDTEVETLRNTLGTPGFTLLLGPVGIGKSHVLLHAVRGTKAVWVDVAGITDEHDLVRCVAAAFRVSLPQVEHRIEGALIVLDGLESLTGFDTLRRWSLRATVWGGSTTAVGFGSTVPVGPLDRPSALKLLRKKTVEGGYEPTTEELDAVFARVGGHPLALCLFASVLGLQVDLSDDELVTLEAASGGHQRHRSLERAVEQALSRGSDQARSILGDLAWFHTRIDLQIATDAFEGDRASILRSLRELLRLGLLDQNKQGFRLTPVAALYGRSQPRSEAGVERYHRILMSAEHLYRTQGAAAAARFSLDLEQHLPNVPDEAIGDYLYGCFAAEVPATRLLDELEHRNLLEKEVAIVSLLARGVEPESRRGLASREAILSRPPNDAMELTEWVQWQWMTGRPPTLSRELVARIRSATDPGRWALLSMGINGACTTEHAFEILDDAMDACRTHGWTTLGYMLSARKATLLIREGRYLEAYRRFRDVPLEQIDLVSRFNYVTAAYRCGAQEQALMLAGLDVETHQTAYNAARARALLASLQYLTDQPGKEMALAALAVPRGGSGHNTLFLARLVLRFEGVSDEPVGDDVVDAAITDGTLILSTSANYRLAAWMIEKSRV